MQYTAWGRTGLRVSVAGLGCGGMSCLGLAKGQSENHAIRLVQSAIDLGVNVLDTAPSYGTEAAVGAAVVARSRPDLVLSTKGKIRASDGRLPVERVVESLENSLRALRTDYVDLFQLHGVTPDDYDHAVQVVLPSLKMQQEAGKIRFIGISEAAYGDGEHVALSRAAEDGDWDVVMMAFHLMHQNALDMLLPITQKNNVGTLAMFVVRQVFADEARLRQTLRQLADDGLIPATVADEEPPLGFLINAAGASSTTDAAYRFVRHTPGIHVTLFGTSSEAHLRDNIASILKPPLPPEDRATIQRLFGHLAGIGLDRPDRAFNRSALEPAAK